MTNEIIIRLSPEFILARVVPTAAELAYGHEIAWLSARDIVAIAEAKRDSGLSLDTVEEALLMTSDDPDERDRLIRATDAAESQAKEQAANVWLFLGISALWAKRSELADPLEMLYQLISEFGYPEEAESLLSVPRRSSGVLLGQPEVEIRWQDYIQRKTEEYTSRSALPVSRRSSRP
jgi:hypothetical protein